METDSGLALGLGLTDDGNVFDVKLRKHGELLSLVAL